MKSQNTEQSLQQLNNYQTSSDSSKDRLLNGMHSETQNSLDSQYPELLKHYSCLESIGHGAQATMLKAKDNHGNTVAIKVFELKTASDWKDVELFEREIEVLKTLKIDGVPKFVETIKTSDRIYLVEQYIDALSLEKLMKDGRIFNIDECIKILERMSIILDKLGKHVPPVIHRDIKPANILVDDKLNVYLVDFGVVANTNKTFSMTFAGTAGYVAPEQLYGESTPASDIFSLGATILHLLSHVAPCDMKRNGILPNFDKYFPADSPKWLSELIQKMMSVNPANRPQNGREVLNFIDKGKTHSLSTKRIILLQQVMIL